MILMENTNKSAREFVGEDIKFRYDGRIFLGHVAGSLDRDGWGRPTLFVRVTGMEGKCWPTWTPSLDDNWHVLLSSVVRR
jgi:hypothetical protein